jgi:hypothetical protein
VVFIQSGLWSEFEAKAKEIDNADESRRVLLSTVYRAEREAIMRQMEEVRPSDLVRRVGLN